MIYLCKETNLNACTDFLPEIIAAFEEKCGYAFANSIENEATTLIYGSFMKKNKSRMKTLLSKKWNLFDCVVIAFKATPFCSILYLILQLFEALLPTIRIYTTADFVDTAIAVLDGKQDYNTVFLPLALMLIMYVANNLIYNVEWFADVQFQSRVKLYIEEAFIQKRASIKYKYIENGKTQDLIKRACDGASDKIVLPAIRMFYIVYFAVQVISVFAVIFSLNIWSGIISVAISVPAIIVSVINGKERYNAFKDTSKIDRYVNTYSNILTQKDFVEEKMMFGYSPYIIKRWLSKQRESDEINLKTGITTGARSNLSNIFAWIMFGGILMSMIIPLAHGEISAGMFIGVDNAAISIVQIISGSVGWMVEYFSQSAKNMEDLSEFSMLEDMKGALDMPCDMKNTGFDSLEFKNVSFAYPETDRYILKNCSFKLEAGEHYAVVGVNGAGKTTITKLITGLYDNYEGDIYINGKNMREYSLAEIKGLFSVVYQDFAKYQIEFEDNIKLGDVLKDDDKRLMQAVDGVKIGSVLDKLPNGKKTPLGKISEDGVDLSGGEWQRLAIARNLYSDAPMKILDEPTAALDPIAESEIYELFKDATKGKSAIFITHRLGAAKIADKILVIADGGVREFGSHNELMKKNGIYAEMFNTQKGWYDE